MAASSRSLRITDRYRDQAAQAAQVAVAHIARLWRIVTVDDLDGSFEAFAAAAQVQVSGVQAYQANLASAYLARFVSSELGRTVDPLAPSADVAGVDEYGRSLTRAFWPALLTVKLALAQLRGRELALQAGQARAQRVAAAAAFWAGRQALSGLMTESRHVVGWRRATAGNPCGACLAAATGAVRETDDVPDVHHYCRCVAEPVVRGVRDRARRPTGDELFSRMSREEQDALFAGRGGERKAQLIRDGLPLNRLITRLPMELGGSVITESPLRDLV